MFNMDFDTSHGVKRRNYVVAFLSGTIAGVAWWIVIDILVRSTEHLFPRVNIIPGAAISFMLIILHFIPDNAIQGGASMGSMFDGSSGLCGCDSTKCARFSLFLVFLIIFSAVATSIWIFITGYASTDVKDRKPGRVQWFGAGNMVFTVLLAIAALLSRFGRKEYDTMLTF